MSDNFKTDTLDSLCELIVDCPHSTPTWTTFGYVVIRNQNITDGVLDLSSPSYTDYSGYRDRTKRASPQENDIVITREAPMGRVCLIPKEPICCLGQRQVLLRADRNKISAEYLYWSLRSPFVQRQILINEGTGATVSNMRIPVLKALEIPRLASIEIENKKAKDLSNIQNKIQLNTQINQTLEQIAQALFKSWFVDFDPVRAKVQALSDGLSLEQAELAAMQAISGKTPEELTALSQTQPDRYAELAETAKAFPCEMVEVDGVEVPKGWEVKRIDEIANIIKGKSYKSSELEKSKTALVTLKSFNRGGGYRLDGLKEYTGKYKPEQEVFAGELIIAYTDVTQAADVIGKPAMVMSDSNYKHLVISLDVGVVRPFNDVYKHFLYCLAMTDSFQAHTKSFCTGTTVLHLGKDAVPSFEFINPNNELLHVFYKQTSPIFEKINLHIEENKNLEKARDLLLPRLLSGEIK